MNDQNKNQRDFNRKFERVEFTYPFKVIFEQSEVFKKQLFNEFIQTERKPDLDLYTAQYFTDEEYSAGMAEGHGHNVVKSWGLGPPVAANTIPFSKMETRLLDISAKFYREHETIDESFFSFDLEATNTVQTLKKVGSELVGLHGKAMKKSDRAVQDIWAKNFAETLKNLLVSLGNQPLATEVFKSVLMVNKDRQVLANIYPGIDISEREHGENYEFLVGGFNRYLSEKLPAPLLPTLTTSTQTAGDEKPSPEELQPKIYIPHPMQTRLYKTLAANTPTEQHEQLELLLSNGICESRIWVKIRAGSLAYIFKQAREAGNNQILADMKETAKWVAAYFIWGKKNPKAVSFDTSYKVLRGNTILSKTNQIRLMV